MDCVNLGFATGSVNGGGEGEALGTELILRDLEVREEKEEKRRRRSELVVSVRSWYGEEER